MEGSYQPITEGNTYPLPQGGQPQAAAPQGQYYPPQGAQGQYYPPQQQQQQYYGQQPYGAYPQGQQPQAYYGGYNQMGQPYVPPPTSALRVPVRIRFTCSIIMLIFVIVVLAAPGWYFQIFTFNYQTVTASLGIWTVCADGHCTSICPSSATGSDCAKFRGMRATLIISLILLVVDLALLAAPLMNKGYQKTLRIVGVMCNGGVAILLLATIAIAGAALSDLPGYRLFFCFFLCVPTLIFAASSLVFAVRIVKIQDVVA